MAEWWCTMCTMMNAAEAKFCTACGTAGEWRCSLCGIKNTLATESCVACNDARTMVINLVDLDSDDADDDCNIEGSSFVSAEKSQNIREESEQTETEVILSVGKRKNTDEENEENQPEVKRRRKSAYEELMELEKNDIVANVNNFECSICLTEYGSGAGVVLRECFHTYCRECLKRLIEVSTDAEIKCPYGDGKESCPGVFQDREIRALVSAEVYEKHLNRSVIEAESKSANTFHCKTPNCSGWCIHEGEVNVFYCHVCEKVNCLNCKVIHEKMSCKDYQEMISRELNKNSDAYKTKQLLEKMLAQKRAMLCPTCGIILTKIVGCDWLICCMCKTEICWATRGPRWGPKGNGDTSGGCRCRVKNKKCHPKCQNCH